MWRKKMTDLTAGESLKFTLVICIASIALTGAVAGGFAIYEKLKDRFDKEDKS